MVLCECVRVFVIVPESLCGLFIKQPVQGDIFLNKHMIKYLCSKHVSVISVFITKCKIVLKLIDIETCEVVCIVLLQKSCDVVSFNRSSSLTGSFVVQIMHNSSVKSIAPYNFW